VFNHPTDRCASCHIEHTHSTGPQGAKTGPAPRQEKPTLVVVQDCQACHTGLKDRLKDTTLVDTPDWGKHPKFRPIVTRGGEDKPGPRLWLTSNPREETGLIFPHDTHLNPLGGPARQAIGLGRTHPGTSPVTCTSCHARQGEGFKPVEMERDCEACHSLAFASQGGRLVKLPHEEPAKVAAFLNTFYGGGGTAGSVYRAAFSPGGACVDCHKISWQGATAVVAPVHLSQSFMPRAGFNHAIEQHGAKSVDEMVCRDWPPLSRGEGHPPARRPGRVSASASDLMMPDRAQCATCHGNPKATKADSAPADCKTLPRVPTTLASRRASRRNARSASAPGDHRPLPSAIRTRGGSRGCEVAGFQTTPNASMASAHLLEAGDVRAADVIGDLRAGAAAVFDAGRMDAGHDVDPEGVCSSSSFQEMRAEFWLIFQARDRHAAGRGRLQPGREEDHRHAFEVVHAHQVGRPCWQPSEMAMQPF
jgi:hypothetical protein